MIKVIELLCCELSALLRFVGYAEVSKQTFKLQICERTGFVYFFNRIFIPRELLAHKADPAHTGVALDVDFADAAVFGALSRERLGIIEREHRLRDIVLRKSLGVAHGSIAQNNDRQLYARGADFNSLVDI